MTTLILRPDSKGRIALGDIASQVSSYRVTVEENGKVTLEPYTEIPYSEKWIFENKELIERLKQELAKDKTEA